MLKFYIFSNVAKKFKKMWQKIKKKAKKCGKKFFKCGKNYLKMWQKLSQNVAKIRLINNNADNTNNTK